MSSPDTSVSPPDLQTILDNKTKPPGSLGELEALAVQIGSLKQTASPVMKTCSLLLFIGDHGIVEDGVSAFPQSVTRQMALNFLDGGAAANVLANTHGIAIQLINAGMIDPVTHPGLLDRSIARGTKNFRLAAAMSESQCQEAIAAGRGIARSTPTDAVCFGEMGIGNTSSASLLFHKVLDLPIEALVGRGTGLDDVGLDRKLHLLTEAAARTAKVLPALDALREYGGFEIAMMAGSMLASAEEQKLVIVDGFIATAAAAVALHIDPARRPAFVFAHKGAEQGHELVLDRLAARPLLDLGLRLGEGTGALIAWPLVRSAAAILCDMATFASAGISGAHDNDRGTQHA